MGFPTWVAVLALFALVSALLSACDIRIGDPGPRGEVGVTVDDGLVLLRVHTCDADALVEEVKLRSSTGKPGKDGELLWEIRAEGGSTLRDYEIGVTPRHFAETVKLAPLADGEEYVARVKLVSARLQLSTTFELESLRELAWLDASGHYLTDEEFENLRPCD